MKLNGEDLEKQRMRRMDHQKWQYQQQQINCTGNGITALVSSSRLY